MNYCAVVHVLRIVCMCVIVVKTRLSRAFENCCVALYGLFVCVFGLLRSCVFNVFVWFVCDLLCEAVWVVFVCFVYFVCVVMSFVWFVCGVLCDGVGVVVCVRVYVLCDVFVCCLICIVRRCMVWCVRFFVWLFVFVCLCLWLYCAWLQCL